MGMAEKIQRAAVEVFNRKGFHGASIREIAQDAGCSLPTLYYHFGSKEQLFARTVRDEYKALLARLDAAVPEGLPLDEHLLTLIKQRKDLPPYDRSVNRLAVLVWLGCEGDAALRDSLLSIDWRRVAGIAARFGTSFSDPEKAEAVGSLIIRTATEMTLRIVLFGEDIPDSVIKNEFSCLISMLGGQT